MRNINDIIKNLKESESGALKRIEWFIFQNYLSHAEQSDDEDALYQFRAKYEEYLFDCLSQFIECIEAAMEPSNDETVVLTATTAAFAATDTKRLLDEINPDRRKHPKDIIRFKYIADMLDLNNNQVCRLLPYLLTAYVCKSAYSSLFSKGTTALSEIFGDFGNDEDQPIDRRNSRRKRQIEGLSKCFSLEGHSLRYRKGRGRRPKPYYVNRKNPYHDALFAERVFEAFAVIVSNAADQKDEQIQNVKSKIDLSSCYLLLRSYLSPDELWEVPDEDISKLLGSSDYLLKAFQSCYGHYSF